jgi:predicted CopG family antitoxin
MVYNMSVGNKRVNVGLRYEVYTKLKDQGRFGESFSDLVSRIIDAADNQVLKEGQS